MKILLLLGSGISIPTFGSDGDCTGLTRRILEDEWYRATDALYLHGTAPNQHSDAIPIQMLLKRLKYIAEDYYRLRGNWQVTYEDLYYLIDQIYNEESGGQDNPAVVPFRDQIQTIALDIFTPSPVASFGNLRDLSYEAINFIKCAVSYYLNVEEIPFGLDGLIELINSKEFGRIDTFTLNHDILLEQAFSIKTLKLNDGFEKENQYVRWYSPNLFDATDLPRIFKLHGSINWRYMQNNDWGNIGIPCWTEHQKPLSPDGKNLYVEDPPIIIAGTYNKERQYYYDIIADMHWHFYSSLRNKSTQLIVVTGYGWNDRSINGRLREWLLRSNENKILLIHQHPESVTKSKSFMNYDYKRLVENKQLFVITKWPSELESGELVEKVKELMA